jgi:hypothetical protein
VAETGTDTAPGAVRRLDGDEAAELAGLAAVFDDLQYVLRCCEHLVGVLAQPAPDDALAEALWTGALVGYARPFSAREKVLTADDLAALELDGDVLEFHKALLRLRDYYASRHVNPRETFTIGVAQTNDGAPTGVAIVSAPQPTVDRTTVGQLGRVAYALSGLVDGRMQEAQQRVLAAARDLDARELGALPLVHLSG